MDIFKLLFLKYLLLMYARCIIYKQVAVERVHHFIYVNLDCMGHRSTILDMINTFGKF